MRRALVLWVVVASSALSGCALVQHPDLRLGPPPVEVSSSCSPRTATLAVDHPQQGDEQLVAAVKQHYVAGSLVSSSVLRGAGTRIVPADALDAVGGSDRWLADISAVAVSEHWIGTAFGAALPGVTLASSQRTVIAGAGSGDYVLGVAAPSVTIGFSIRCADEPPIVGAVTAPYIEDTGWKIVGCGAPASVADDPEMVVLRAACEVAR